MTFIVPDGRKVLLALGFQIRQYGLRIREGKAVICGLIRQGGILVQIPGCLGEILGHPGVDRLLEGGNVLVGGSGVQIYQIFVVFLAFRKMGQAHAVFAFSL